MKTKVIEFITSLGDGGAETLVKDYALLLDKDLFDITILTRYPIHGTANMKILNDNDIKIITLNSSDSVFAKIFNKITKPVRIPLKLRSIIRMEKPDVIHVHLCQLEYMGYAAKYLKDIRIFYTCHNIIEKYFGPDCKKELKAAQMLIRNNGMRLIALHDDMRRELNTLFNTDNTVVIRNGIDFERFNSIDITKSNERQLLGIPENAFVIGHVGRFTHQKNHPFLIEIFREASARDKNAFLLLVGAGDTAYVTEKLKEYNLETRCMILSNRSDIPQIMRAMDVFVFPSLYEGLGIVLIEAQAMGLRCIISDAVPDEAVRTRNVIKCSLEDSPVVWVDNIYSNSINSGSYGTLDDYDMRKEIKKLEQLYLNQRRQKVTK
ncbi:MAG: glycosyltransferase [Oscillospiraceae bacterium]|nr:glycosyltransferase [Oscillospiraceae bacterium]